MDNQGIQNSGWSPNAIHLTILRVLSRHPLMWRSRICHMRRQNRHAAYEAALDELVGMRLVGMVRGSRGATRYYLSRQGAGVAR